MNGKNTEVTEKARRNIHGPNLGIGTGQELYAHNLHIP